jgi:hypothetical protein
MISTGNTPANAEKIGRLQTAIAELLQEVLRRGFHGSARVELVVSDGTIQSLRRTVEQIER